MKKTLVSGDVSSIGEYRIEISRVCFGLGFHVTLTHSLTQKESKVAYACEAVGDKKET